MTNRTQEMKLFRIKDYPPYQAATGKVNALAEALGTLQQEIADLAQKENEAERREVELEDAVLLDRGTAADLDHAKKVRKEVRRARLLKIEDLGAMQKGLEAAQAEASRHNAEGGEIVKQTIKTAIQEAVVAVFAGLSEVEAVGANYAELRRLWALAAERFGGKVESENIQLSPVEALRSLPGDVRFPLERMLAQMGKELPYWRQYARKAGFPVV